MKNGWKIICGNCLDVLPRYKDSVHMIITSPPYNVGFDYGGEHNDSMDFPHYLQFLRDVFAEMNRALVEGGRLAVIIGNTGRRPYRQMNRHVGNIADEFGLLMRGEIIWDKGASGKNSTAWGSYQSASNPVLRDEHEYILVFSKGERGRKDRGKSTISGEEFRDWTHSVWHDATDSAKRRNHPCPFPEEIVRRLVCLYTYEGDLVLDPFCGSGTTPRVAVDLDRRAVGIELNKEFCNFAKERMRQCDLI